MIKKEEPDRKCRHCGKPCWGKTCQSCFWSNNNRVSMWRNRKAKRHKK
jgi:hypothetical protein